MRLANQQRIDRLNYRSASHQPYQSRNLCFDGLGVNPRSELWRANFTALRSTIFACTLLYLLVRGRGIQES